MYHTIMLEEAKRRQNEMIARTALWRLAREAAQQRRAHDAVQSRPLSFRIDLGSLHIAVSFGPRWNTMANAGMN